MIPTHLFAIRSWIRRILYAHKLEKKHGVQVFKNYVRSLLQTTVRKLLVFMKEHWMSEKFVHFNGLLQNQCNVEFRSSRSLQDAKKLLRLRIIGNNSEQMNQLQRRKEYNDRELLQMLPRE